MKTFSLSGGYSKDIVFGLFVSEIFVVTCKVKSATEHDNVPINLDKSIVYIDKVTKYETPG